MNNLLIYYGWLNAFNSAHNQWNNEKVSLELSRYNLLVLGNGLQDPNHGDYANTEIIIARIQELNPNCKIFGYVSVNQSLEDFQSKVDDWETLLVNGIFFDEAGYDFGTVLTNSREAVNTKVAYVHSQANANLCFINAWRPSHIWGIDNDPSYLNSTYNPDELESILTEDDWYLMESFAIDSSGNYESASQWSVRGDTVQEYSEWYGFKVAACSVIADECQLGQEKFNFISISAFMHNLDAIGSSDIYYGASSAASKMWVRPDFSRILRDDEMINYCITQSGNDWIQYCDNGLMKVNFSTPSSDIICY